MPLLPSSCADFRCTAATSDMRIHAGMRCTPFIPCTLVATHIVAHGAPCPALPYRLAAPLGVCSVVGVGGLALNGGLSLLSRAYGATADNILEATVVLADGSVVSLPAACIYGCSVLPGNKATVMLADAL